MKATSEKIPCYPLKFYLLAAAWLFSSHSPFIYRPFYSTLFPHVAKKSFFLLLLQDFAKMNHVGRSIILGSSNLIWFKFLHLPFFNLSRSIRLRIQYALNCYRSVGQKRKFKIGSFCFWPFKKGLFSTQIVCMVLVRVKRIFQKSAAIWWEILKIGRREKNFLTNNFRGKEEKVV